MNSDFDVTESELEFLDDDNDKFNIPDLSDNILDYSCDEYCMEKCDFFESCYANHEICIKQVYEDMLNTLTPREIKILKLRYGWYAGKKFTFSEISKEFNLSEPYIKQLEKKIIIKLRSQSQNKILLDYLTDIALLQSNENFYKSLYIEIFGEIDAKEIYRANLGIDYSVIDEEKSFYKSVADIKNELSTIIFDIDWLNPYFESLSKLKITTLNHLLHISPIIILKYVFEYNEVEFYKFVEKLKDNGFKIKGISKIKQILKDLLIDELRNVAFDFSVYEQNLNDLPMGIMLKLVDEGIMTIGLLVEQLNKAFRICSTEKEREIICSYLKSKHLLYSNETNATKLYLTAHFINSFLEYLVEKFQEKGYSIFRLKQDLQNYQPCTFDILISVVERQYPEISYNNFYSNLGSMIIDKMNFSVYTLNCLMRANIRTVEDLISRTETEIRKIRNLGQRSFDEIIQRLSWYGLKNKEDYIILERKVNNDTRLKSICAENVFAFMFAEGGAMGAPGEFKFYLRNNDTIIIYFGNRYDKSINQQFLDEKYRELKDLHEWEHIALGMGNHCCIHPIYAKIFKEKVENSNQHIYKVYNEIIIEILESEVRQ